MDKKKFIKILESIQGNPDIGINVLTNEGSEFWVIDKHSLRLQFGGSELSLFQCRLKNPLPARVALKLKAPAVDSIDTTLETVIAEFLENFDMTCKDAEDQDHILDDFSSSEVQEICLQAIRDEITKLLRLNEDMIRVLGNKKEHQKFHLTEDTVTK